MNTLTPKQRKMLTRILTAAALYAIVLLAYSAGLGEMLPDRRLGALLFLVPYLTAGYDVLVRAFKGIRNGQVFSEHFLMAVATFGAFGIGEYSEAAAVMIFYQVGEFFQDYAVNRSRRSIAALMDICPETANLETEDGIEEADPDDVEPGSVIVIRPGERIPLDGVVVEGQSLIDTSALTGESVPRRVRSGEEVVSGCVNGEGLLRVRTTKAFEDSTVSRILELVENASSRKAKVENFIARFARWYTPAVVISALVLALVPPLLTGAGFVPWIRRGCIFLVISCPCALLISVPLSFFGGIGAASRCGVLVKGSNFLEELANLEIAAFDKTGTITRGEFRVTSVHPAGITERELLRTAAVVEQYSTHPIAASIREAYAGQGTDEGLPHAEDAEEIPGRGISAVIDGKRIYAGSRRLMEEQGIACGHEDEAGTAVYLGSGDGFLGSILISDRLKDGVRKAIADLRGRGVRKTVMLTGDRRETAEAVAAEAGIDEVHSDLLPGDKVSVLEKLLSECSRKGTLAFVGDGINDAPVLARADVGIAMGSLGSDAAIEAADVVLMDDDPGKIVRVIGIARKTVRIAWQNILFALGVKAAILLLGAAGRANMWEAVFADVGVCVIAVLNAMRALREDGTR